MDLKFLIPLLVSLYAAALATYTFYIDRTGRLKITYQFCPNLLVGNGAFAKMHLFKIINISSKKRIISRIGYQFNNSNGTIYCPIERFLTPVSLEFGDLINYDVFYDDWDNIFEKIDATKFQLIVTDTTGKKYKTHWIKIRKANI